MSEVNSEENPKHAEAMSPPAPVAGEGTDNAAFQTDYQTNYQTSYNNPDTEISDNIQPPSYDESASMPLAGGDIKGTLPPAEPVIPIQLNSIPPEPTNPVIVMAPTSQPVHVNPYTLGAFPVMITCPNCHQTVSILFNTIQRVILFRGLLSPYYLSPFSLSALNPG